MTRRQPAWIKFVHVQSPSFPLNRPLSNADAQSFHMFFSLSRSPHVVVPFWHQNLEPCLAPNKKAALAVTTFDTTMNQCHCSFSICSQQLPLAKGFALFRRPPFFVMGPRFMAAHAMA